MGGPDLTVIPDPRTTWCKLWLREERKCSGKILGKSVGEGMVGGILDGWTLKQSRRIGKWAVELVPIAIRERKDD